MAHAWLMVGRATGGVEGGRRSVEGGEEVGTTYVRAYRHEERVKTGNAEDKMVTFVKIWPVHRDNGTDGNKTNGSGT